MKSAPFLRYCLCLTCFFLHFSAWAGLLPPGAVWVKEINKDYVSVRNKQLQLRNIFGNVVVRTWDRDEIKVTVELKAVGRNETEAKKIVDYINILDSTGSHTISFTTVVGDMEDDSDTDSHPNTPAENERLARLHSTDTGIWKRKFSIDYLVFVPATLALAIENSYGNTTIPDFEGHINVESWSGDFSSGNLSNVEAIDLQYGNGKIGNVRNGKFIFNHLDRLALGKISGTVEISADYSEVERISISKEIKTLKISQSFCSLNISTPGELSAIFTLRVRYGSFFNKAGLAIVEKKVGEGYSDLNTRTYEGSIGAGKASILIETDFVDVNLIN
jgi:hypothetical protein